MKRLLVTAMILTASGLALGDDKELNDLGIPRLGIKISDPPPQHYIAVQGVPLNGKYVSGRGIEDEEVNIEKASMEERDARIMKAWGIDKYPATFRGLDEEGKNIDVVVVGSYPNQLGLRWEIENRNDDGVPIMLWSGHLDVELLKTVEISLPQKDELFLRAICVGRGLELKHLPADQHGDWYHQELIVEDRLDLANPQVEKNVKVKGYAPHLNSNVILARCLYRSVSKPDGYPYFGPTMFYDLELGQISRIGSVDFDDHLRFMRIENQIYIQEYDWCDECETFTYSIRLFSSPPKEQTENAPAPFFPQRIRYKPWGGIEKTLSWFHEE